MSKEKNYQQLIDNFVDYVGGKDNISYFTHCVTRLRVIVKDKELVKEKDLKETPNVIGIQWLGGQLQIIIGADVEEVYRSIISKTGIEEQEAIDENLDKEKKSFSFKEIVNKILGYISPTMTGVIPLMMAACLCKTIGALIGPDILKLITADSDLYMLLDFMYDAFFYFMPIFLGYSACKSLNINPIYGLYLGALIMVPDFTALVGVRDTFNVFGINVPVASYASSFLPVILGAVIMKYVYKFLNKFIPEVLRAVFVPLLTIIVMAPVMFAVCGPIGTYIGNVLGNLLIAMSQSNIVIKLIGAVLLAVLMPYMVLSGIHGALVTYAIMVFMQAGSENFIMPIMMAYNFAVFGVTLGVAFKIKKKDEKTAIFTYFLSGILGSVTEPCLYGVVLKYKKTMTALLISCVFIGLVVGIFLPTYYVMTSATAFTFFVPWVAGGASNMIKGNVLMLGALIVGAIAAYLVDDYA